MLSLTRRVLQEREGDVRLDALGGMGVHPDSLGSAGLLPLGDHLLGHAVADEVATRRSGQAHGALGTRSQTDVIVGVTVGSAAPGGHLEGRQSVELDKTVAPAKDDGDGQEHEVAGVAAEESHELDDLGEAEDEDDLGPQSLLAALHVPVGEIGRAHV